jgi:hypothetical protein
MQICEKKYQHIRASVAWGAIRRSTGEAEVNRTRMAGLGSRRNISRFNVRTELAVFSHPLLVMALL